MITKEQLKDIGWALSVLRGLDRLGFAGEDAGPRLESATAGFKALAMAPTGPYTTVQRAELLIRQLPVTHEGRNLWLKDHGEGLHTPAPYCTDCDGTAKQERAAPKAYADACSDRGQQTAPAQPLSFEDDIKSKDW